MLYIHTLDSFHLFTFLSHYYLLFSFHSPSPNRFTLSPSLHFFVLNHYLYTSSLPFLHNNHPLSPWIRPRVIHQRGHMWRSNHNRRKISPTLTRLSSLSLLMRRVLSFPQSSLGKSHLVSMFQLPSWKVWVCLSHLINCCNNVDLRSLCLCMKIPMLI